MKTGFLRIPDRSLSPLFHIVLKQSQTTWRISDASSICPVRALEAFLLVKAVSSAEESVPQNCTSEESILPEKTNHGWRQLWHIHLQKMLPTEGLLDSSYKQINTEAIYSFSSNLPS